VLAFPPGSAVPAHHQSVSTIGEPPHQSFVIRRQPDGAARPLPIVFVHGCCGIGGTYWDITPDGRAGWATGALAAGYVTYVVDLPGHGRAPQPNDFASMGLAPAVAALQALVAEVGPAVVVGHSMGGAVITRALAGVSGESRERFAAAVLVDPARVGELNEDAPERPGLETSIHPPLDPTEALAPLGYDATLIARYTAWRGSESGRAMAEMTTPGRGLAGDRSAFSTTPTLLLAAEPELGIGQATMEGYARTFGLEITMVGDDWGLRGHSHGMNTDVGNDRILERLLAWIDALR